MNLVFLCQREETGVPEFLLWALPFVHDLQAEQEQSKEALVRDDFSFFFFSFRISRFV